jgi:hypothetical protein
VEAKTHKDGRNGLRPAGAEMGIPTMIGREFAGMLRVKAEARWLKGIVRFEARRDREQHHTRVGMPEPENRFAAILWWTLFKRSVA